MSFSVESIAHALVNIYKGEMDIDHEVEEHLFQEASKIFRDAIDEGYANAAEENAPLPEEAFREAILHSADVFSAFRTHRMQKDIAAQLLDSKGQLKPFSKFVKDVSPYIEHRNRTWLQTEYDTAVIRAQNAAEWKMFEQEKDVYPNLEWIQSTSPDPGADHMIFWGTIRPVDDAFWNEHRPGDRWNCKCELRQTDKNATAVPESDGKSDAARGLETNPAKAEELFSQKHPYYPHDCMSCPFAGNKLMALAMDLVGRKNCHACAKVDKEIETHTSHEEPKKVLLKEFKNGGSLSEYDSVPHSNSDYKALRTIGRIFAKKGSDVCLTPRIHFKSDLYKKIYGKLMGTLYERKCPDLRIDGKFYEYEGFQRPWSKKKVSRMLSHGIKQSDRIIIDNTKGCSHRYIRKLIIARMNESKMPIVEAWVYEKGELIQILKDGTFTT